MQVWCLAMVLLMLLVVLILIWLVVVVVVAVVVLVFSVLTTDCLVQRQICLLLKIRPFHRDV